MARVVFYEKPGCGGNARQKALLRQSGHDLDVRDLLTACWTGERLRAFFGARPVAQWFNAATPRERPGEVRPESCEAEAALALMLADPLLIRRPLIEVEGRREAGFDAALIDAWIGLAPAVPPVGEGCVGKERGEAQGCAAPTEAAAAEDR